MLSYFVIFVGGGLGASLRHAVNLACIRLFGVGFPFGTVAVNIVGSALMGALIGWLALRSGTSPLWRAFAAIGVLGGFTTFSAFSLDILTLFERGQAMNAVFYALVTVIGSIAAVFAGIWCVRNGFS